MKVKLFTEKVCENGNYIVFKKWVFLKRMSNKLFMIFGEVYVVEETIYPVDWINLVPFQTEVFVGEVSKATEAFMRREKYLPSNVDSLTMKNVEDHVLNNQPEFSYEEDDWWHGYVIDGFELDVQYLYDEDKNLYVYEIVDGVRQDNELMVIPVNWEFNEKKFKFEKEK